MKVPAHLQDLASRLALRTWVKKKSFPSDLYFETIDEARDRLSKFQSDSEPTNEQLVPIIATAVDHEGALLTHVLEAKVKIDDDPLWKNMCTAAAWTIIQRYELDVKNGDWPHG